VARTDDRAAREGRLQPNMTPMIDVVFQLIIVFLCSMKFRTLDQKIEGRWDERFRWEAMATRFRSSERRVPGVGTHQPSPPPGPEEGGPRRRRVVPRAVSRRNHPLGGSCASGDL